MKALKEYLFETRQVTVKAAEDDFRLRVAQFRAEVEGSVERATTAFSKRQVSDQLASL